MPRFRLVTLLAGGGLLIHGAALGQTPPVAPPQDPPNPEDIVLPPGTPDPSSPLSPMADVPVVWPDLGQIDASEGEAVATAPAAEDQDALRRYTVEVKGLEALPEVSGAFADISTLMDKDGRRATAAAVYQRTREDVELMRDLLRSKGYYDASVTSDVRAERDQLVASIEVVPGPLYRFADVTVKGLAPAEKAVPGIGNAFDVRPETPVDAQTVIDSEAALREKLGRSGYPFATVNESQVVVDHESSDATLTLTVDPEKRRRIGSIIVTNPDAPFDARHAQVIARFRPGEYYDQAMIDDYRRAIVATGIIASVQAEPTRNGDDKVDIRTTLSPAPMRTLAGELGYGTGEGFKLAGSWQHRNLIRPEGAVTVRGLVGTREQSLGAILRMNNFRRRDRVLNARIIAAHQQYAAYNANTVEIGANLELQTNLLWQKRWTWSYGFEILASDERDYVETLNVTPRRTYFIGALPTTLAFDGTDDLLDPKRGFRLAGRVSPEASLRGGFNGYVRTQIDGSAYYPVGERIVIAGRARVGAILGADQFDIAPSRRYYAGGGGSVRGFGFQELGPRNAEENPIGGRSLVEFSLEGRARLPWFGGNFGAVAFVDAGNVYPTALPRLTGLRAGVGVGVRYYTNFGPIRADIATPLGRRPGESPVAVYISLGQAF